MAMKSYQSALNYRSVHLVDIIRNDSVTTRNNVIQAV